MRVSGRIRRCSSTTFPSGSRARAFLRFSTLTAPRTVRTRRGRSDHEGWSEICAAHAAISGSVKTSSARTTAHAPRFNSSGSHFRDRGRDTGDAVGGQKVADHGAIAPRGGNHEDAEIAFAGGHGAMGESVWDGDG